MSEATRIRLAGGAQSSCARMPLALNPLLSCFNRCSESPKSIPLGYPEMKASGKLGRRQHSMRTSYFFSVIACVIWLPICPIASAISNAQRTPISLSLFSCPAKCLACWMSRASSGINKKFDKEESLPDPPDAGTQNFLYGDSHRWRDAGGDAQEYWNSGKDFVS